MTNGLQQLLAHINILIIAIYLASLSSVKRKKSVWGGLDSLVKEALLFRRPPFMSSVKLEVCGDFS